MLYLYPLSIKLVWCFWALFCYPIPIRWLHDRIGGWYDTVYSSGYGDGVFEGSRMRDFDYKRIHINFLPLLNLNTTYIIICSHRTHAWIRPRMLHIVRNLLRSIYGLYCQHRMLSLFLMVSSCRWYEFFQIVPKMHTDWAHRLVLYRWLRRL